MVEKSTIKCEAIFSDDARHRYILKKEWNKSKPRACVITIAPSADFNITTDLTTQLIQNNLAMLDFGGFELVNLISAIGIDVKRVKNLKDLWGSDSDKHILEASQRCDTVVLAWGKFAIGRKGFEEREEAVMKLLEPYKDKLHS